MIYNIVCEITEENTAGSFEERLTLLCRDKCQYASNAWFVDYVGDRKDLFSNLREVLTNTDTLIVNNIDFNSMAGWLPGNVIDWIKNHPQAND